MKAATHILTAIAIWFFSLLIIGLLGRLTFEVLRLGWSLLP